MHRLLCSTPHNGYVNTLFTSVFLFFQFGSTLHARGCWASHFFSRKITLQSPVNNALVFFGGGATAPSGPRPPHSRGFQVTHNDAPQSVGLLWTSDQLIAETSTWQHTTLTTDIHAPGRIWTHNLRKQGATDPHLRPHGLWDQQTFRLLGFIQTVTFPSSSLQRYITYQLALRICLYCM
jgi:hypothetical protein